MADFKNIQKFVALVDAYNTRDDKRRDLNLTNLGDRNYRISQAHKMDNALADFKEEYGLKKQKVGEVFDEAKALGFVEHLTNEDNPRVIGEVVLVTFRGKELIRTPWVLHRFLAWLEFRNNLAVLTVAVIGAGILAHIDKIIRWLF